MTCCIKNNTHKTVNATVTDDNLILSVTNDTNISSIEDFNLITCIPISDTVTGSPIEVRVEVNGASVPLYNRYSLPILSNRIPKRAKGSFVTNASGDSYIILHTTPLCKANA